MRIIDFKPIELSDLLKLIGAFVVFAIGLYQYVKAQKWKRAEFIAAQIKEMGADPKIQTVMKMLDWSNEEFCFPSDCGRTQVKIPVDDDLLCGALLPHEYANGFTFEERKVRDYMDAFLEMLVRLENFTDARLISVNELRPYMDYWVRLVSGNIPDRHGPQVFLLLLNYMQRYGFEGASRLIRDFGYNPLPSSADIDRAIRDTVIRRSRGTSATPPVSG